jgi:nucleotide-binding universal stress UspA family protein
MGHTIKRILVPVDFSAASRAALWRAGELATALGATIELLHVVDLPPPLHVISEGHVPLPPEYRQDVLRSTEDHLKDWLETAQIPATIPRALGEGKPFVEIVKYAREHGVDLIVMGTHGRGGISHLLLGSVADKVIRTAPCPVMTVRADEHPAIGVPGLD